MFLHFLYKTLSWNFSYLFIASDGDKLLVSILLPTPLTRTTPVVLLVLDQTIFYFEKSFNHKWTGKTDTEIFKEAENKDDTKCTI